MLKNNKGFTVIELIASFVFVSILAISLFAIVINYSNKEKDSEIKADLLAFKSKLTIDIEQDIQRYGLKRIDYCDSSLINTETSCIILSFNNGTQKKLQKNNRKCWEIYCDGEIQKKPGNTNEPYCGNEKPVLCGVNQEEDAYSYYDTFLSYGGVRYIPPDYKNVTINSDNLLEYTVPSDGLENNVTLYKIRINLSHIDIDADADISIVALGTEQVNTGAQLYESYTIGDRVLVQLNSSDRKEFVVINNSGGYTGSVTLLYNDYASSTKFSNLDTKNFLPSPTADVAFNDDILGNRYTGGKIEAYLGNSGDSLKSLWYNTDNVRLITVDELARIASISPNYRRVFNSVDEASFNLNTANQSYSSWLFGRSYWTSAAVSLSSNDQNYIWIVDNDTGYLHACRVNGYSNPKPIVIRPVIEIDKVYVTRAD